MLIPLYESTSSNSSNLEIIFNLSKLNAIYVYFTFKCQKAVPPELS